MPGHIQQTSCTCNVQVLGQYIYVRDRKLYVSNLIEYMTRSKLFIKVYCYEMKKENWPCYIRVINCVTSIFSLIAGETFLVNDDIPN